MAKCEAKGSLKKETIIPRNQSLAVFFSDLGIQNMVTSENPGQSWEQWRRTDLNSLEVEIRERASCGDDREILLKQLSRPSVSPEIRTFFPNQVRHPSVETSGGTTYTFIEARTEDVNFIIATRVKAKGTKATSKEYTILELRELLKENLVVREQKEHEDSSATHMRIIKAINLRSSGANTMPESSPRKIRYAA